MSESNTPPTEGNLRALAWIVTEPDSAQEHIQRAFAIDAKYVYRREIDQSQAIPRPTYYRAEQKDVLADDSPWDFARFWEPVAETGEALGQTYSVRVTFEHLAIVRAVDEESAKVKALRRLNIPDRLQIRAVATLMPEAVK